MVPTDCNSCSKKPPIALTIAGSDSGGGAGIQADLKAFSALGVYGASVITAVTAQNTRAVTAVQMISPEVVCAQIKAVLDDIHVDAIKIGMLSDPATIDVVASELIGFNGPIVLDPVMVAKSGDRLLQQDAIVALKQRLIPMATLITPNIPEAAALLDCEEADSEQQMLNQGRQLLQLGHSAVLMKGGHASGDNCVDWLLQHDTDPVSLSAPRIATSNTHGTGCTLSAAIAAQLSHRNTLLIAVQKAHGYLHQAIKSADALTVGHGHGPVHHFYDIWR